MADPLSSILAMEIGFFIIILLLGLSIIGLIIFLFIFWILMIVDAATRKFKNDSDKVVWILVLIFLQILGAIIYYFVVKRNK